LHRSLENEVLMLGDATLAVLNKIADGGGLR